MIPPVMLPEKSIKYAVNHPKKGIAASVAKPPVNGGQITLIIL